jgi:hypothetical protein
MVQQVDIICKSKWCMPNAKKNMAWSQFFLLHSFLFQHLFFNFSHVVLFIVFPPILNAIFQVNRYVYFCPLRVFSIFIKKNCVINVLHVTVKNPGYGYK